MTNATFRTQAAGRIYSHISAGRPVAVNGAAETMADLSVGEVACLSANITDPTEASKPVRGHRLAQRRQQARLGPGRRL